MTTVRDLIRDTLGRISILGAGENLTAEDAVDNVRRLNQMLDMWSADGAAVFNRSVDTKVLTGNVATYTMGPGGDIDTTRPVNITNATITVGGVVTGMNIWAQNVVSNVGLPALQGPFPSNLFVNNGSPLVTLRLYPVPSGGQTLTIYSLKPLAAVTLDTVLDLPPGYELAMMDNLAVLTAPSYEREASKTVQESASMSLSTIKANNLQYFQTPMAVDYALDPRWGANGQAWGYNIYGGN